MRPGTVAGCLSRTYPRYRSPHDHPPRRLALLPVHPQLPRRRRPPRPTRLTASYESIRHWCENFGAAYARRLRHWAGPVGDTWHLDELFVTIRGQRQYLWRAVDQDGEVLDILLQPRRDHHAAARFFRKLLKRSGRVPHRLVTDRFGSYRAHRVIMPSVVHDTTRYANNRAEVSPPTDSVARGICGASNRWHRPSGSSRSTTSFATCSPLDDIGFPRRWAHVVGASRVHPHKH